MSTLMAASNREGKKLNDVIFQAGAAVRQAIAQHGSDAVVNGTLGSFALDDGSVACLPVVEKLFHALPMNEFVCYAPPVGLPGYKDAVIHAIFADQQPDAFIDAVASAGGTGAVHMAIANYSEPGDAVLTSDWRWDAYGALCSEIGRNLQTFSLFDGQRHFNVPHFQAMVNAVCRMQDSLLIILNTPAHNPTGFSLSSDEWDAVIDVTLAQARKGKKMTILVDIAYIDYAGEKNDVRSFMKKFTGLPDNVLILFAFSMSKGYTLYGQRAGALAALSCSKGVIEEFHPVVTYSARAAWSNVNRGAMTILTMIQNDKALQQELEREQRTVFETIRKRSGIFIKEASECQLPALPYQSGFFISIPAHDSAAVCNHLHEDLIFAGPLAMGVRFAVCSVSADKMTGVAAKIKKAFDVVGE